MDWNLEQSLSVIWLVGGGFAILFGLDAIELSAPLIPMYAGSAQNLAIGLTFCLIGGLTTHFAFAQWQNTWWNRSEYYLIFLQAAIITFSAGERLGLRIVSEVGIAACYVLVGLILSAIIDHCLREFSSIRARMMHGFAWLFQRMTRDFDRLLGRN